MYSLKNRAFAGMLALLMLLSMTGCAGTTSGEESSSSTITQEEYENLKVYLFEPYEKLGGNGSAKRIMQEVDKLPIHKFIQNKEDEHDEHDET